MADHRTDRVTYIFIGLLLVLTIASGLAAYKAAQESRWNREVLCIGILGNSQNTASADVRVKELCRDIGVVGLKEADPR